MKKIFSFFVAMMAVISLSAQTTYTVAGNLTSVFGTSWDPSNTANDMVLQESGLYQWEKTDLALPAGTIEFKVCEDHAWTVAYPAQNYQLSIAEEGSYTLTITFNPEDNAVAANAEKTGTAEIDPTVSIAGGMNGWSTTANEMTLAEDKATASLTLNLAAASYEFKVVLNGGDWRSNAQTFTRENASATDMTGNLANMSLVADAEGDYVFTWTFATNTLSITFPEEGEPYVPTLANGYYLIGLDAADWTVEYLTADRLFSVNPENEAEYMVTVTLAENQEFKVVSVVNDVIQTWYPDGMDNNYIIGANYVGEKTVYFRPDGQGGDEWHYGYIYVPANEEQPEDTYAEIVFTEAIAADDLAEEASFSAGEFTATIYDAGNKMAIDANDCRFGTAESYKMYNFRIKSGGASSSTKNYFMLNIPAAGTLRIAPRTGSNNDTTRVLVIAQGETELYNAVVRESQAIKIIEGEGEGAKEVSVYPYVEVPVEAGSVRVSYTAGMNFYAFAFKADEEEPYVPTLENGYYLIGLDAADWTAEYLTADRLFSVNPENEAEYMIEVTLAEGQAFKAVYVENDEIKTWYPDGMDNNYIVGAEQAGPKTIYFRPDGQGGEGWHYGYLYIGEATGFEQTTAAKKAIKRIENGQLIIMKGGKTFNAQGAIMR